MSTYRIKAEAFRGHLRVQDYMNGNTEGRVRWSAAIVDKNGKATDLDGDHSYMCFGDTKAEAILELKKKLETYERLKKELNLINSKEREFLEITI